MKCSNRCGMTVIETMVSLVISGVVLGSLVSQFSELAAVTYDARVQRVTDSQAETLLNLIGFDLRMLGTGVPFHQTNFEIGESILSDASVTEPILTSTATASKIEIRMDEDGDAYVLTQNFDPGSSSTVYLDNVSDLAANDIIYIANGSVGEDDGLKAEIQAVNTSTKTITLKSTGLVYNPGAIFSTGSTLSEVSVITFNSPVDGSGVTRSTPAGTVILVPRSTFSLQYIDDNGSAITLPISSTELNSEASADLNRIIVTVSVKSSERLRIGPGAGAQYTSTMSQTFSPRNLNLVDF